MTTSKIALEPIRDPWLAFLRAVDQELATRTEIHCIGGFAVLLLLDHSRPTGDVDCIEVLPHRSAPDLDRIAGSASLLAAQHKLHLQRVSVADKPCDYAGRLLDATPAGFRNLVIKVLDPYDLILTKVQRNFPRDRQDAGSLVSELGLDGRTLRARFEEELEPYLALAPESTIRTFGFWMEEFFPGDSA